MQRLLRSLIVEPIRWAIQEATQWVLGACLLLVAWWIGSVSGGRWQVALALGVVFVFLLCRVWLWSTRESDAGESDRPDEV